MARQTSLSERDIKQMNELKLDIKDRVKEADMGQTKKDSGGMMKKE